MKKRKLLNHPKASLLLGAMFSGMNGAGGMQFDDDEMDEQKPTASKSEQPKQAESAAKPDPKSNLTPSQKEV